MSKQNQLLALSKFAWQSRRWHVLLALLFALLTMLFAFRYREVETNRNTPEQTQLSNQRVTSHWAVFDRIVTATTLAVAIAVWLGEVREEWERRLPRKLFAYFLYKDKVVAACLGANIGGAHDARALGQQIGAQMFVEASAKKLQPAESDGPAVSNTSNSAEATASENPTAPNPTGSTQTVTANSSGAHGRPNKQLRFDVTRIDQTELETVIESNGAYKPIAIVFRLTDDGPLKDVELPHDQALLWTPTVGKPESISQSDARCQQPIRNRLNPDALKAARTNSDT